MSAVHWVIILLVLLLLIIFIILLFILLFLPLCSKAVGRNQVPRWTPRATFILT
jgi:hypothetical protein